METRMNKTIDAFVADLATIRAGRANPSVLDRVMVDYYGVKTPVTQLANVSVPEPRMLTISPYDAGALRNIEKAIIDAEIGLNPTNDGKLIRIAFPPLTEERRKEIVKALHKREEEAKVVVRNIRRDGMDGYKKQLKDKEITEDDLKGLEKDLQMLTDKKIEEVEKLTEKKEKEILEV